MKEKTSLKFNEKNGKTYDVNGIYKTGAELNYNDVQYLYNEFYNTYGKYPTVKFQTLKYNVPHSKILARVLDEEGITLNDFQNSFGVVAHVRSDPKHYDIYLEKFKELYIKNGDIESKDLYNNKWGLPNPSFFIKYCPDESVKDYVSFVKWCGFKHKKIKDKTDVINALIEYESKVGRPITKQDLTVENIGFSEIVITRLWGSISKCKEELGLLETKWDFNTIPFDEYKQRLDNRLDEISKNKTRKSIAWRDLETKIGYKTPFVEHHSVIKKFESAGIDFTKYLLDKGFEFNPSSYGHSQVFPDGEKTKSNYEYDYSAFLKEIGLVYNQDYKRDVMYKTFCEGLDNSSKINCDYKITLNEKEYYIEIAGIIESENDLSSELKSNTHIKYQKKMIVKKDLLDKSGINYLFLYSNDMDDGSYKEKTKKFLGIKSVEQKSLTDL